jgi:hypothetical protein
MLRKGIGLVVVAGCLYLSMAGLAMAAPIKAEITIQVSPQAGYVTRLSVNDEQLFSKLEDQSFRQASFRSPITDTYLTTWNSKVKITYTLDQYGNLYDTDKKQRIELDAAIRSRLINQVGAARAAHYGALVQWDEAKQKIALKDNVKVIDMETGMTFNAQRRAGQLHADVQPLTKEDTAIMKRIYNGKWSWHRKAVLVQAGSHSFAASMHGMPHGGDGIPDNDFSGHFCIHFLGSKTHGSGQADPGHQLMVYKAAGKINDVWSQSSPYGIARTFIIALNLKEFEILKQTYTDTTHEELQYYLKEQPLIAVNSHNIDNSRANESNLLSYNLPLKVRLFPNGGAPRDKVLVFKMMRVSLLDPWKINSIDVQ